MTGAADHVAAHPARLLITVGVIVVTSWLAAGWAIVLALDASRSANVATCRQLNEYKRSVVVVLADLGVDPSLRAPLTPTKDCEALP